MPEPADTMPGLEARAHATSHMLMSEGRVGRRASARESRRAARQGPLPEHLRPVHPGQEGGRYLPLSPGDIRKVHETALRLLSEVGLADAPPSGIEYMRRAGCTLSEHGRMLFPRALVEDVIARAGRHFVLHGQDARNDMEPWGRKVYFGTAGAAISMVERNGRYRDSTVRDLYDIGRIVDALEHIHFFQRTVVPRDIPDAFEMDFNTCYASVTSTTKHVGTSWVHPAHMQASLEMLHLIAGGEARWRERPFVSQSNCFVVPPMKFATDACLCLEAAVHAGMPVFLVSAGQAGATAPAAIAGALAQEVAEVLAGLVYVNSIRPGHPAIFGTYCFVSDLRTGAMCGGSPEQALLSAAAGQIAHFYDLTCGTASGMTDSKVPDEQCGAEKALSHALVGNAGANLIYECAGMHASLLGFSLDSLVIDNDIIGAAQRTIKAIDFRDEYLSFDVIRDVCLKGPGHFLGADQTLQLMQSEYVYPLVGDRRSPSEWAEKGSEDVVARAARVVDDLLAQHYPTHIPPAVDDAIRARFPVRLPREHSRPAEG
jgi:trimethylamine--corrinoid protein Co-methyltransferase